MQILSTTFTGTGAGTEEASISGKFDLSIRGFGVASVDLQRSFDDGDNWETLPDGTFTADTGKLGESKSSCKYRFNCTEWTSGTIVATLHI